MVRPVLTAPSSRPIERPFMPKHIGLNAWFNSSGAAVSPLPTGLGGSIHAAIFSTGSTSLRHVESLQLRRSGEVSVLTPSMR